MKDESHSQPLLPVRSQGKMEIQVNKLPKPSISFTAYIICAIFATGVIGTGALFAFQFCQGFKHE